MDNPEEREAIMRLKKGDINGLDLLVMKYQVQAIRTVTLITRDRSLAEDIVQNAFIRAFDRIGQLDPHRSFGPWFLKSVVNDALKAVTRRARFTPLPTDEEEEEIRLIDEGVGPEDLVVQAETAQEIAEALDQLAPRQRAAIVMRYFVGLSEAESAEKLQCTPGTIKRHLYNAKQRLQHLLKMRK